MQRLLRKALLLSLLLHFLILFLFQAPDLSRFQSLELAQPIWIDLKKGKYEIADILPPVREEKPDEAKFLGMYDSRVEEERVAPTRMEKRTTDSGLSAEALAKAEQRTMDHGLWTMDQKREADEKSIVPAEDYFPDFRHGSHTYLNVLRFPDIQYFVMLKKVFRTTFNPHSSLSEAYFQNRITMGKVETVLGVSIDPEGNLAELFVFQSSGIREYDDEALRTIRASSPFSKPPSKLMEGEDLLRMSWTFTVYL